MIVGQEVVHYWLYLVVIPDYGRVGWRLQTHRGKKFSENGWKSKGEERERTTLIDICWCWIASIRMIVCVVCHLSLGMSGRPNGAKRRNGSLLTGACVEFKLLKGN